MWKALVLIVLMFGLFCSVHAQDDYRGIVFDATTKNPIPFVNIGFIDKGVGTVSDENGYFSLPFDRGKFSEKDILQFSSLGYTTINKTMTEILPTLNNSVTIAMTPSAIALDEIIVTNEGTMVEYMKQMVGYENKGEKVFGYWKDNVALGGELGTKVLVKKGLRKLNDFRFTITDNASDSVLIRINIYKGDTRYPEIKINQQDILKVIAGLSGQVRVDLEPYKIYVENHFTVSLELLKVYGSEINMVLLGTEETGTSYKRNSSQDKWEAIRPATLAFQLSSALIKPKKADDINEIEISNRMVSGLVFHQGKPLANVQVKNETTGHIIFSDAKGRFTIEAETNDFLVFTHHEMEQSVKKILDKPTVAVHLRTKEN